MQRQYMEQAPKEFAVLHREALKRVVQLEGRSLRSLKAALNDELSRLIVDIRQAGSDLAEARVIRISAKRVIAILEKHILRLRKKSRKEARRLLREEFKLLGIELRETNHPVEDYIAAASVAQSYSSAWTRAAMAAMLLVDENESVTADDIRRHINAQEYRVRRIVTTETFVAFNDEHKTFVDELEDEEDPETKRQWVGLIAKRWDAILDSRTCKICRGHDGELALLGMAFSGGDEPGFHPNCRCLETLIPLAAFYDSEVEDEEAA